MSEHTALETAVAEDGRLKTINDELLAALEGLLTDENVLLFLPNYNRTARTCSGCGSRAYNDAEVKHEDGCSVGRAIATVKDARKE